MLSADRWSYSDSYAGLYSVGYGIQAKVCSGSVVSPAGSGNTRAIPGGGNLEKGILGFPAGRAYSEGHEWDIHLIERLSMSDHTGLAHGI